MLADSSDAECLYLKSTASEAPPAHTDYTRIRVLRTRILNYDEMLTVAAKEKGSDLAE